MNSASSAALAFFASTTIVVTGTFTWLDHWVQGRLERLGARPATSEVSALAPTVLLGVEVSIDTDLRSHGYPAKDESFIPFLDIRESTRDHMRADRLERDCELGGFSTRTELTLDRQADGSIRGSLTVREWGGCLRSLDGSVLELPIRRPGARVVLSRDWYPGEEPFVCAIYRTVNGGTEYATTADWYRVQP